MGAQAYRAALRQAIEVLAAEDRDGEVAYLPHVAAGRRRRIDSRWRALRVLRLGARRRAPSYRNEITADTGYTMLTLDTATVADLVTVPALIVHGETDHACPPAQAALVYDRLTDPRELVWLPTDTHIGFCDDET